MDRRSFLGRTLAGAAAVTLSGLPLGMVSACAPKKESGNVTGLKLSFQEGIAPGKSLSEKLDYMESLGVVGFEPGGGNLAGRVNEIQQATEYSTQAGAALEAIVQDADNTADEVSAIATASQEQSAASDEINRSINEVNLTAASMAQTLNESAQAIAELAQQAKELSALVEQMRRG